MLNKNICFALFALFALFVICIYYKYTKYQCSLPLNNGYVPKYVLIYADWCPACRHFKPIWEETRKSNKNIELINVNTDIYDAIKKGNYVNNIPLDIQNNISKLNIQTIPHIYSVDENNKMIPISIKEFMELKTD